MADNHRMWFDPKGGYKTFQDWKTASEEKVAAGTMTRSYYNRIVNAQIRWDRQHARSPYRYYTPSLSDLRGHGKPSSDRAIYFPSLNGEQPIIPRNYREASKLGRYYAAVKGLDSDNPEVVKAAKAELRSLSRMNVYDANGQKHSLKDVTNLEMIRMMQDAEVLPEGDSIYVEG